MNSTILMTLLAICVVGGFGLAAHHILGKHVHPPDPSPMDPILKAIWGLEVLGITAILGELFVDRLPSYVREIRAIAEGSGEAGNLPGAC
jgi:hypothetical protein